MISDRCLNITKRITLVIPTFQSASASKLQNKCDLNPIKNEWLIMRVLLTY